ncbi:DUF2970 domain-containing protein [Chitinilyticum piscinae]|uniref:DUF2970 domain-containing protein n=1 Tax=Chitinilyticum piscinae TaxID=2866724 RepID=A0A8J7FTW7_9NEIS|nr:DUF2970 domain-containing protein [Chitinilyticum piscinae]MBE9610491.1 DUF2970 domain-containing protein [Chitinilyticum piscinae]
MMRALQTVLAALFGVQSRRAASGAVKPWQLLLAACLLLVLLGCAVRWLAGWLANEQASSRPAGTPATGDRP